MLSGLRGMLPVCSRPTNPERHRMSLASLEAPSTFDELVQNWTGHIRFVASRYGKIPPQDLDDFTQDAIVALIERDAKSPEVPHNLCWYDPRQGSFAGYLRHFVLRRCMSRRRELAKVRQALTLNTPVTEDRTELGDLLEAVQDLPLFGSVEEREAHVKFRAWLRKRDPGLDDLFVVLTKHVLADSSYFNGYAIAEQLGYRAVRGKRKGMVSLAILDSRLKDLRAAAREWGYGEQLLAA